MADRLTKNQLDGFFVIGMSHRSSSVNVRERFTLPEADRDAFESALLQDNVHTEQVLLMTCNRIEIYGFAGDHHPDLQKLFARLAPNAQDIESCTFQKHGTEAVRHLFRVTSGMDSMVLGETEITAQVKQAYTNAHKGGRTARALNKIFQTAFQSAKAIRSRTQVCTGATSIGAVCALRSREFARNPSQTRVLILGAGAMAETCLRHLVKNGYSQVTIANRCPERASRLARELGGEVTPFADRGQAIAEADVVICSTSAPDVIVDRTMIADAMAHRPSRPLLLLDIAVPRDVDPSVDGVPGVTRQDMDALGAIMNRYLEGRQQDLSRAEAIITQHLQELQEGLLRAQMAAQNNFLHVLPSRRFSAAATNKRALSLNLKPANQEVVTNEMQNLRNAVSTKGKSPS